MSLIKLFRKTNNNTLFTTPSHGKNFFVIPKFRQFIKYDISETDTHNPVEALELAEKRAAKIYGTYETNFLTNGSTSGILAAVLSCAKPNDKVLLWKKSHPSHLNAVKLANAEPVFYDIETNEEFGVTKVVDTQSLKEILSANKISALIVTSPTYEGIVSDIKTIKNICSEYGTKLIVDEAHGALYPFSHDLPESSVNIADFTVQSLHKTAGGINPTALLHSNCEISAKQALKLISTTSPSYPILASIEANIDFLQSKRGQKKINELIENIKVLHKNCPKCDFLDNDITKIVVRINGLSGFELSEKLFEDFGIEDELSNEKSVMLLCGIGVDKKMLNKLEFALNKIAKNSVN